VSILLLLFGCAHQPTLSDLLKGAEETGASAPVSSLPPLSTPNTGSLYFISDSGTSYKITAAEAAKILESSLTSFEIDRENLPSDNQKVVGLLVFDDSQQVTTGDGAGDVFFRIPSVINGWELVSVAACNRTVATGTGSQYTSIQIRNINDSEDILTNPVTIDEDESDSSTANYATAYSINTNYDDAVTGDQWRVDIDTVPSTPGYGLYVELTFKQP
jgi:hypothetical protein